MKYFQSLFLIFLCLSCSKEYYLTGNAAKAELTIDRKAVHANRNPSGNGDFIIKLFNKNELMFIQTQELNSTISNKVWVVAFSEDIFLPALPAFIENGSINISADRRYFTLKYGDEVWIVGLDEDDVRNSTNTLNFEKLRRTELIKGCYGISYQWGSFDIEKLKDTSGFSAFENLIRANLNISSTSNRSEKCTSGGIGSSGCSIDEAFGLGGCSVSCSTGYHSCCQSNTVTCSCVKDKPIK
jgi:hypothetical protein